MRGATDCAKRLKQLFSTLRSKLGKASPPPVSDPVSQLVLGILSRNVPEAKASEGLDRLRGMVVDHNELRVIPAIELAEVLGDFPDARLKCEDISRALNRIFATEHAVTLERVAGLPRKEMLAYLERVDGLEAYSRARIRLLGFRTHAIPLDEAMWALARREEIVSPRCDLAEAQQFLERQINESDALEFVALLKKQAWAELGGAVKAGEVERVLSVPPDRTARNMLQAVSSGGSDDDELTVEADDELGELPDEEEPVETEAGVGEGGGKSRARRKTAGGAAKPAAAKRTATAKPSKARPRAASAKKVRGGDGHVASKASSKTGRASSGGAKKTKRGARASTTAEPRA